MVETSEARSCGDCDVCCTAMQVSALNKPAGVRCTHMTQIGCDNYQHRPAACRDWYCMWLRDRRTTLTDDERPDRVGLFLTASQPHPITGEQEIYAHPVRPGVMAELGARNLVARLRQFAPVRVLSYQGNFAVVTHEGKQLSHAA